jgi:hypothetical protein
MRNFCHTEISQTRLSGLPLPGVPNKLGECESFSMASVASHTFKKSSFLPPLSG